MYYVTLLYGYLQAVQCTACVSRRLSCALSCILQASPKEKKTHSPGFFPTSRLCLASYIYLEAVQKLCRLKMDDFRPPPAPPYHVVFFIKEGLLSKSVGARPGRGGTDTTQFMDGPLLPRQLTLNFLVAISQALHTQQTHLTHLFEVNFRRDIIYIACKTNHTVCISF